MAKYLLDTQILIWALEDNPKLKPQLRTLIEDPGNEIFFSQLSLIEISIKLKIGKLPDFTVDLETITRQLLADDFIQLPIKNEHIFAYYFIPLLENHRDPFDRLLLATAFSEDIPILTGDEKFLLFQPLVQIIS